MNYLFQVIIVSTYHVKIGHYFCNFLQIKNIKNLAFTIYLQIVERSFIVVKNTHEHAFT